MSLEVSTSSAPPFMPELEDVRYTNDVTLDKNLLEFPVDITQPKMPTFLDRTYANDLPK